MKKELNLRWWNYVLWMIIVGLCVALGWRAYQRMVPRAAPVPYTVVLRETISDRGGTRSSLDVTTAIRSDGSRAIRNEHGMVSKRMIELVSGVRATIDDILEIKTTLITKDHTALWLRDPKSNCLNNLQGAPSMSNQEVQGFETLSGYRTIKIKRENMLWWFALDFGCARVRSIADFGEKGRAEKMLVSLSGGEPQASLFHIPASYRQVTDAEMAKFSKLGVVKP